MKIPFRNTPDAYGAVAQLLHWGVVIGIMLQFIWAWRIDQSDSIRLEFALVNQHKSMGMTVLALAILRLLWRAFNRPPGLPAGMAGWQQRVAAGTHWLLYALIVAMPLSGWAYSSAAGYGAEFFGLLDIPDFVPQSESLEDLLHGVHEWLGRAILAVAGIHILAALHHQFVVKDNLMKRMLPVWKSGA